MAKWNWLAKCAQSTAEMKALAKTFHLLGYSAKQKRNKEEYMVQCTYICTYVCDKTYGIFSDLGAIWDRGLGGVTRPALYFGSSHIRPQHKHLDNTWFFRHSLKMALKWCGANSAGRQRNASSNWLSGFRPATPPPLSNNKQPKWFM